VGIGGAAAAWSLAVRAQQGERMRQIGVLIDVTEDAQARIAPFLQVLRQLGWADPVPRRMERSRLQRLRRLPRPPHTL
jgi:hypothetical protein